VSRLALALWFLFFTAGCSLGSRPLQFNLGNEALQLDWNRSIDTNSAVLLDNVMEGLTSYVDSLHGFGADLLRPMPALASSWSVSEGGRVYRFNLKRNIYWSDGVELVAQHFVDSWERLLNPGNGNANSYQLLELENAAPYVQGKLRNFSQVGVKALDPYTLEVRLRRAVPYFLHLVASASTFPIRRDLIDKYGDQWTDPGNLVTLGPYRIAEWAPGERIVLRSYVGYHGASPRIPTVICRLVSEPLTAFTLYENGDLDILPRDLPPSFARRLQAHVDYRSGPKLQINYLLFNVHRPPLDSPARRRAFIGALNRAQLASYFEGSQAPFSGWIPPGLLGHDPALGIPAEGHGSKELEGKSISLRFGGSDTWNLVFQGTQRTVLERLGAKVKFEQLDQREFGKLLASLSSSLTRPAASSLPHVLSLGWVADYPDPHSFMNIFTSSSENNYMGWKNARYDGLVEKAVATADESLRKKYYQEAQKLLLEEEVVLMPLFLSSHQALVRSNLHGVNLNLLDKWYFQNVEFLDEGWKGFGRGMLRRLKNGTTGAPGSS
jgi:oligopeptide transport system substrate-binding protein